MKFTKDLINEKLISRGIVLIGDYSGTSNKSEFQCKTCGDCWDSYVTNVIHKNYGCPKCAGNKKLSGTEVTERLLKKNIVFNEEYKNSLSQSTFSCLDCGHSWRTRFGAILGGQGCPGCSGNLSPSLKEISERLSGRNIELIGIYKNNQTKTDWKCLKCGYIFSTLPTSVFFKNVGCPECKDNGFDESKETVCYLLEFDEFIKYGITQNLNRRMRELSKNGSFEIIKTMVLPTGTDARFWERDISTTIGNKFVDSNTCPYGWTETIDKIFIDKVKLTMTKEEK